MALRSVARLCMKFVHGREQVPFAPDSRTQRASLGETLWRLSLAVQNGDNSPIRSICVLSMTSTVIDPW
jgi:hypothetical protein